MTFDLEPNAKREFALKTGMERHRESWLASIKPNELQILRTIVKKVHLRHYPKEFINDYQADRIIELIGPETGEKMVKRAIDRKLVS